MKVQLFNIIVLFQQKRDRVANAILLQVRFQKQVPSWRSSGSSSVKLLCVSASIRFKALLNVLEDTHFGEVLIEKPPRKKQDTKVTHITSQTTDISGGSRPSCK